jgi:hypothetical protein
MSRLLIDCTYLSKDIKSLSIRLVNALRSYPICARIHLVSLEVFLASDRIHGNVDSVYLPSSLS